MSGHTQRQTHILDRLLYLTTKVAGDEKFWGAKSIIASDCVNHPWCRTDRSKENCHCVSLRVCICGHRFAS